MKKWIKFSSKHSSENFDILSEGLSNGRSLVAETNHRLE